ncbi:MAG TPA: hypothetical protein VFO48_06365 [Vicinamibacterales bacterium]|nr:hypothetical protein [Vicinamibacterales bacterium]
MHRAAAWLAACAMAGLLAPAGIAHKGITSKYTYNGEVHSIFQNRCGRCHIDGGVGPMSLLKYEEAFPWAEALRVELLSSDDADPHDFVRAAHRQISARELDIIIEWASGGTPEGDKAQTPPVASLKSDWPAGAPDLVAKMPAHQLRADVAEATHESAMPIAASSPITIGRIDVLPGNPAIVRSAVLSLRSPDGTTRLLGTWVPRQVPAPIALKPPVQINPGSHIVARLHYKKNWKQEGEPMTDLSLLGLYVAN